MKNLLVTKIYLFDLYLSIKNLIKLFILEVYSDLSIEILLYLNENKHLSLHNMYEIDAFLLNKVYLLFFFKIVNENYKFIRVTRRIIYFTKDKQLLQFKYNSKLDALLNNNISLN